MLNPLNSPINQRFFPNHPHHRQSWLVGGWGKVLSLSLNHHHYYCQLLLKPLPTYLPPHTLFIPTQRARVRANAHGESVRVMVKRRDCDKKRALRPDHTAHSSGRRQHLQIRQIQKHQIPRRLILEQQCERRRLPQVPFFYSFGRSLGS